MKHFFYFLIFSKIYLSSPYLFGQEKGIPLLRNYPLEEYDSGSQNWAIIHDKRGVVYFGNEEGILEYDGENWRQIKTSNESAVRSLGRSKDGTIFVGGVGEFGYLSPSPLGELQYVSLSSRLDSLQKQFADVWSISTTSDGVYFLTDEILFRYDFESFKTWKKEGDYFYLCKTINDKLYIHEVGAGIKTLTNDRLELIPDGEMFAQSMIHAFIPYKDDQLIIGTMNNGLYRFNPREKTDTVTVFKSEANEFLKKNKLYHGIELSEGKMAFGTIRKGLAIINEEGKILELIDKESFLQDETIYYLHYQRKNVLWIAMDNGLAKLEVDSPLRFWDESTKLKGSVLDIIKHQDTLYVATSFGLYYLETSQKSNNHKISQFKKVPGIEGQCWDLIEYAPPKSSNNEKKPPLLLAGGTNGIFQIEKKNAKTISNVHYAFKLYTSEKFPSKVLIGGKNELAVIKYHNNSWIPQNNLFSFQGEIRDINEDQEGNLWLATSYKGLIKVSFPSKGRRFGKGKLKNKSRAIQALTYYDTLQGLPSLAGIRLVKYHNRLLFATEKGLLHFNDEKGRFFADSTLGEKYAEGSKWINRYYIDKQWNFWVNGTEVFWKENDGNLVYDQIPLKRLPKKQVEVIYIDQNQAVWMGGTKGLFRYNPEAKREDQDEYLTLIRKVICGKDSIIFSGTLPHIITNSSLDSSVINGFPFGQKTIPQINYKSNHLTFSFSSPFFDEETKINYSYYLKGFDKEWSTWKREAQKEYTNLPEGEYTFLVKAKNFYGKESQTATFSFVILPPWYRTLWAYLLYFFLVMALVSSLIKLRLKNLKKEKFQLEKLIEERTSEIQNQKEQLSLQAKELREVNQIVQSKNKTLEHQKEEITQQAQALQLVNLELKNLSLVASETDNAIGIFSKEGHLEWVNAGFTRMYGYSLKEFIMAHGKSIYWNSQNPSIEEAVASAMKNKKSISYEFSAFRKNGQKIWGHTTISSILDENGQIFKFVAIDSDITSLKIAEKEIKKQRDELQRLNLEKDNFFSLVAHDLRSPLGTLLSLMRVLSDEFDNLPHNQLKELLVNAHRSAANSFALLENLLEWALTQKGKIEFNPKEVDISLLCAEVIDLLQISADKKDLQLLSEINESIMVYCDENMIRSVLRNLISNAIKFTSPPGRIILSVKEETHHVLISVIDTGRGMTKEELSKIFQINQPFSTLGTADERGTGLGLLLSKDFIK
ncbi:ATP-binding protein, partial [Xanthovirga aplysinae]|uniref:ATP-binding protein n=1 Tax=Xanthovirga aplysinae TaxID=2529853 RepID=UPI0012BC04E3